MRIRKTSSEDNNMLVTTRSEEKSDKERSGEKDGEKQGK